MSDPQPEAGLDLEQLKAMAQTRPFPRRDVLVEERNESILALCREVERLRSEQAICRRHGDPLVCLACEAEEDARPEWRARHRCSGCGHRWEGLLPGAELCGDCWRKVQPILHAQPIKQPEVSPEIREMIHDVTRWRHDDVMLVNRITAIVRKALAAAYAEGQAAERKQWQGLQSRLGCLCGACEALRELEMEMAASDPPKEPR